MIIKYLTVLFLSVFLTTFGLSQTDGIYCAAVERYNPRTQKESSYTLTVDIKNKLLMRLYFPNGGYMDYNDFEPVKVKNNKTSFSDFKGIQFKVELIKKGTDCFDAFPKLKRCTAYTKSGARCKNKTRNKSGRCYLHDK